MNSLFKLCGISTFAAGLLATTASAAVVSADTTIVTTYDPPITVTSGDTHVDLNGDNEFDLTLRMFSMFGTYAHAKGLIAPLAPLVSSRTSLLTGDLNRLIDIGHDAVVDQSAESTYGGTWSNDQFNNLYSTDGTDNSGPIANIGDRGFFAFKMDVDPVTDAFGNPCGFQVACQAETYYGWLEIEHGSIILHSSGISSSSGLAAVTPGARAPEPTSGPSPVPLPAGLPLLIAGLGGLTALRRKG